MDEIKESDKFIKNNLLTCEQKVQRGCLLVPERVRVYDTKWHKIKLV